MLDENTRVANGLRMLRISGFGDWSISLDGPTMNGPTTIVVPAGSVSGFVQLQLEAQGWEYDRPEGAWKFRLI